ncbi:MAG: segregation/condensation protein A [Bacteroidetes bacterium]|nr:segregation/condensation protein A [Bacteroidota bacterium]MCY4233748.1 segregation/condensation protein A [Bacteroidota bacterium]
MYRVQLQDFEGPLDLLLLLINRREIDIFDIPIAQITNEYLSYVGMMKTINLDGVGDYIYFAALLISIKARMLLPKPELGPDEEEIDPRQQLVEQLLEYIRYKDAAEDLNRRMEERSLLFTRGAASTPAQADAPEREILVNTSVFDLLTALRGVLEKAPDEQTLTIVRQEYSIEEQSQFVRQLLFNQRQISFVEIMKGQTRGFIVCTFLAILEMAFIQQIKISNTYQGNDFMIQSEGGINE